MYRRRTDEEQQWLRDNCPNMSANQAMDAFEKRFGWMPTYASHISYCSSHGIQHDHSREHVYTQEHDDFIRQFAPGHAIAETIEAFENRFGKRLTKSQMKNRMYLLGVQSGVNTGRFVKGQPSRNKGLTWDDYMSEEGKRNSLRTCFKKGNIPQHNRRELGDRVICSLGYVRVKVKDGLQDKPGDNWAFEHRHVWEQEHGEIPEGYDVVHLNGDITDNRIENLALLEHRMLATINRFGYSWDDAESLEAVKNLVRIQSKLHTLKKQPRVTANV